MKFENSKGFTLIELAVVLGVLGILSAALVMSGTKGRRAAYVDNAAIRLESALKETQAFGKAGRAFPLGVDPETDDTVFDRGYGVNVQEGSGVIYVYGGRGDGSNPLDSIYVSGNVTETITFDGGVTVAAGGITTTTSGGVEPSEINIFFRRGANEVDICVNNCQNASQIKDDVTIRIESEGQERSVFVNKEGLIYTL